MSRKLIVEFDLDALLDRIDSAGEGFGLKLIDREDPKLHARIAEDVVCSVADNDDWAFDGINADVYSEYMEDA